MAMSLLRKDRRGQEKPCRRSGRPDTAATASTPSTPIAPSTPSTPTIAARAAPQVHPAQHRRHGLVGCRGGGAGHWGLREVPQVHRRPPHRKSGSHRCRCGTGKGGPEAESSHSRRTQLWPGSPPTPDPIPPPPSPTLTPTRRLIKSYQYCVSYSPEKGVLTPRTPAPRTPDAAPPRENIRR